MADKEHAGAQCKYHHVCGRDIEGNPADGLCILHSTDPAKDARAFAEALAFHREHHGDSFIAFVFPGRADFAGTKFSGAASFSGATFSGLAVFGGATFGERTDFGTATFGEQANFGAATFGEQVDFSAATFSGKALFAGRQGDREVAYIFAGAEVNFTQAVIDSPDVVTFLQADLTQCQFLDTDLRKVHMVGVK
jgi:uncharacterized protein YjbI with pentapeptide repeats